MKVNFVVDASPLTIPETAKGQRTRSPVHIYKLNQQQIEEMTGEEIEAAMTDALLHLLLELKVLN